MGNFILKCIIADFLLTYKWATYINTLLWS